MKRFFALMLVTCILLTACGGPAPQDRETHTITDQDGFQVELPLDVQRVVVCDILRHISSKAGALCIRTRQPLLHHCLPRA